MATVGGDSRRKDDAAAATNVSVLMADQIAYYRARAPEYDQWWAREGPSDFGPEFNAAWASEIDAVGAVLSAFNPTGEVLELAAGTGGLTVELARWAKAITAVDASPEALEINRAKLSQAGIPVEYVTADLFAWEPSRRYDVVFFSFWLSHVPVERFDAFWAFVARSLRPDGRFFFVDSAGPEWSRFSGASEADSESTVRRVRTPTDVAADVALREVADGRQFHIVKRFWTPDALRGELEARGWEATVAETAWAFIYGHGRRSDHL